MYRYILRRILISIPVLLLVTFFAYGIYNMASGDPVTQMINPMSNYSPSYMETLRESLGLNKPWFIRYFIWLRELLKGNMGYSYISRLPVLEMIIGYLPATLQLTFMALIISIFIGIPLGIVSAIKQNSKIDYIFSFLSFTGVSIPSFFFGIGVLYIFSLKLGWFPSYGMGDPDKLWSVDRLQHLILPAFTLGLAGTASYLRYMRSSLLEVIGQQYIKTARGKGLPERIVIMRHAFRNALLPMVTIVGLQIPALFGGAVVVEHIFNWPGIGQVTMRAVIQRDYTLLMGVLVISAILIFVSNLLTDISYCIIDPRIKYE